MGASAEGKISLSVELANFKDLASNLKKGLSAELKQVPLDIEFNNKELEKRTAEAVSKINEMLKGSRIKGLDLSSILPNFVNALNAEGIGEDARARVAEGFATGLGNFKEVIDKTNYSKFKNLGAEELKKVFTDLNTVMDIINSMKGLSKRQRKAMIDTFTPSMSDLDTRGGEAAWKKYTKGAKKLDAMLQLKDEYSDVLQYGTSKSATREAIGDLSVKLNSSDFSKKDAKDLIGYITRYQFIGGENAHDFDKLLESDVMTKFIKEKFKEGFVDTLKARSNSYFEALDKIFNSTAREIDYSDLLKGVDNTTNKKLEGMYNSKASEELEKIEVGKEIRNRVKIKSDEKPELRKREKKDDEIDTSRRKTGLTKEDEEEFKFDDEERSIAEIEKDLQDIESRLNQVRDKLTKTSDERTQLENEIANQEKVFKEKDTAYTTFKSKYEQYSSFAKNAKYEADALKGTVANLDEQLEEEKQNKEKIESRYNQLIKKREEIKKEIEEKEKQLETILPKIQEQETGFEKQLADLDNKKKEAQKVVKDREAHNKKAMPIQDEWLEWYDEALQKEYKFEGTKAKSEAFDALKKLGNEYVEFRKNPDSSLAEDKEAEAARFAVRHYKLWQAAKEAGVAESRLEKEKFDTDDDLAYQQAIEYLQKQRESTEKIRENLKAELEKAKGEVTKIQEDIDEVKRQQENLQKEKSKLLQELRVRPANNEDENEAKIRREQGQLESSNSKIQKLETSKGEAENRLNKLEEYLQKNELTEERKTEYDNQLEDLKKERDAQEKLLKQKKDSLQTTISEQNQLIQLEQELQESQNALIQEQKESKARQEELDRQEEERRKKAEEERKKQEEANRKKQENKTKTDSETKTTTEETQGSGTTNTGTISSTGISIPPEKLQEILILLGNIQKVLGTLEDGSDIPSITQSIKNMADALKELSDALSEIKQKDFNLNIGLPSNNPIGQQGEAKRKILKELAQQYDELNSYFVNKYGDDSSAFNALSKLNGGSNYVNTMMPDYSIIGDTNASLSDKIEVYKTLIEQLRSFLIQEGGDINSVLTNVLSPEEIINKITDDIAKFNPTTALQSIFDEMKISIDASLAQINTESKGFNFLSGSAEEAAEAKRKFVEANKEVFQSIITSIPNIEQESEALNKIENILSTKDFSSKELLFNSEQLEQFSTVLIDISGSLNKIQVALGTLDDNSDIPSIVQSVKNMLDVFQKLELLIDDINNKKIKFGFSSNPNEKLIGEMNSEDVRNSLATLFDDAIKKLQEFKTNIDMSETVKSFKKQMAEMEKAAKQQAAEMEKTTKQQTKQIERLEQALEKEKKAREDDKAKAKAKEDKRIQEEARKKEEKARQEALAREKAEQERQRKEEEALRKKQEEEEKRRIKEEQEQQERLLKEEEQRRKQEEHNKLMAIQEARNESERLVEQDRYRQAEKLKQQSKKQIQEQLQQQRNIDQALILKKKERPEMNVMPLEEVKEYEKQFFNWGEENGDGQLTFLDKNTYDLTEEYSKAIQEEIKKAQEIAEEEGKKASPILLPLETQISFTTNEDINRISKSMERDLLDDKAIQKIKDQYASLITSDKYINSELNVEKILHPFEEQFTKKGINTKNYSELTAVGEEIKKVKAELASSFDSEGNIIGDPLRVKELLEQYNNLIVRVKELKAAIQSPTSEENVALQMAKDADKAKKELEKLKAEVDKFFENRKNDVVRSTAEQVISAYGTTNEEGKLLSVRSSFFDDNPNYQGLIEQQNYVIALAKALEKYKIAVENLKKTRESDIIKVEDLKEANNQVKLLEDKIKQLETIIKKVGKGKTNATDKNINDLRTKIQSILENNSDLPEDAAERLKDYLAELESGASISKAAYDSMTADIKQFSTEQKKSFSVWGMMTMKIKEGIAFLATKFSFYQIFNQFRQGAQVIRQFDDALTEMMKVSDESRKTLEAYQKTTFDTADAIGSNALQIQNSTADFMRLGESLTEAAESAKTANVLMNVSEFQSIDEATKSLIAMSAAYDDLSKAQIIDKLNEVGNNYSISTSGAAEALQASASALKTAGNDMDEALALVTAGNQIVQDVAKAGNGLRTIALRLTGK